MKRFISCFLAVVLLLSVVAVPASAAEIKTSVTAKDVLIDTASVTRWDAWFSDVIFGNLTNNYKWAMLNSPIEAAGIGAFASRAELNNARSIFLYKHRDICSNPIYAIGNLLVDGNAVNPVVVYDDSLGVYRLKDARSGLWIVSQQGKFPYYKPTTTDPETGAELTDPALGGKWIPFDDVSFERVNIQTEYSLYDIGYALRDAGSGNDIATLLDKNVPKYEYIKSTWTAGGEYYVYCDQNSRPYVLRLKEDEWAQNAPNHYYTGNEGDNIYNSGDTVENQLIDNSTNTVWFPDGTLNYINQLIYDESTKTYYVDASTSYDIDNNTYITNNYSYTYHINYTSVTYIGQTAEYDEVYEFYYELPDGRNSADLTAEELQVLNTQIDVLPYIRSADDASIRALYHFDGDTLDSSYWSHMGKFNWLEGASLTYMDAGPFNGALYLDENAHGFNIQLPSALGSGDWTIQWRWYQSDTLTPSSDVSVQVGYYYLLQSDGAYWYMNDYEVAPVSVGSWSEFALVRSGSTVYLFVNGVLCGSMSLMDALSDTITFYMGSEQQTYKYFDELRVVSKALYDESGYTPTSVPHDTNLALVLPDSQLPVADEYWEFNSDGNLLPKYDFTVPGTTSSWLKNWQNNCYFDSDYSGGYSGYSGVWAKGYFSGTDYRYAVASSPSFTVQSLEGALLLRNYYSTNAFLTMSVYRYDSDEGQYESMLPGFTATVNKNYVFSVMLSDGSVYSVPFRVSRSSSSMLLGSTTLPNGAVLSVYYSSDGFASINIIVPAYVSLDIAYMELVEGTSPNTGHELVSSVVAMDRDDLHTPSLAVRTDLEITGYQIGGVRPSLPEKGLVWAMVESGRITSLQVYNGQAWEQVDGRIWTGSRWVPYYAYDVLLLKDLWDIVESDPTLDPIYTETGFWTWLQNAWSGMIERLDKIISALGGSSTTVTPDGSTPGLPGAEDDPSTEEDEGWHFIDLLVIVKDGAWKIVSGVITTGVNGIAGLADGVSNIGGFFNAYDPDTSGGVLDIMNVGSSAVWD